MRLATFNILHGRGMGDGVVDLDRLAAAVRSLDADILALQEVDRDQPRSLTVPVANSGAFTPVGSAVLWDHTKAKDMFGDIARGDTSKLSSYAK